MTDLVFIDTETTGFSPKRHEVIDIWALRTTEALEPIAEDGGLVLPEHIETAEPRTLEINGYDPERWAREAKPWAKVWERVWAIVREAVLSGHNHGFDAKMINAMNDRNGIPEHVYTMGPDTCRMARKLLTNAPSVKLDTLCEMYQIEPPDGCPAHSAKGDVYRTLGLYKRLRFGWGDVPLVGVTPK
jgi:DNA polymerase III epsilon subunit-like protein